MLRRTGRLSVILFVVGGALGCTPTVLVDRNVKQDTRSWLAGDHHIHSQYSVGWNRDTNPPTPEIGGDAIYPISTNAAMAQKFGLSWMVTTDHGGPNHSKVNLDLAYPELLQSRESVSEVIQFYGMELNTPAGEHSSLIIPHTHDEAQVLYQLESRFDRLDAHPEDPARDTEQKMIDALVVMRGLDEPPVVIANHPSRTMSAEGEYGAYHPSELRRWNDTAPDVAVGMAGAPGHQALALTTHPGAKDKSKLVRGGYGGHPNMGGFDQMTAKLGGFWESMLAEGRRWWITANSDSHIHYTEKGVDFWPGEYSKTYVMADKNHQSILEGIRAGHVFVTTGDLIEELYVDLRDGTGSAASIGDKVTVENGSTVSIDVRLKDPDGLNAGGHYANVNRVDLIVGKVTGESPDPDIDRNEGTRVLKRFNATDWTKEGDFLHMSYSLRVGGPIYVRVRGTNTDELEPENDPPAENPWLDLWFYSNPVFVDVK